MYIKKQTKKRNTKITVMSLAALIAITATSVGGATLLRSNSDVSATNKQSGKAAVSKFTFTGAKDWRQGPTRIGDIALFHKIQDSCFVSVQHITDITIAAHQKKKHKNDDQLATNGHIVTPIGTQNMTIKTDTGLKHYQLQQTNTSNPAGASANNENRLLSGNQEGYLPLDADGFIYVEGHCETAEDLASTIPALQAITYDARIK